MKKLNFKKVEVVDKIKNKKLSKSALILIVGIIIIAIPCIVFASILGISAIQTGSPRDGSRFKNDLANEISKKDISAIETDLNSISNVENIDVVLSEGQLKVFIDTNDTLTSEDVDKIILEAYNKITSTLPVSTYFTRTDSSKMYDLQINVYTTSEASSDRQYKLLHKNSSEEEYSIDDLAHSKSPSIVAELHGETAEADGESSENSED